ncbi:hypothetical protein [Krasilnikovia sp. MM14-A1259]|uniref:hypothetical protein n=1 Tax=Krasilnikovia sp. MM14-A1259 TaxID=3373539 RepID=UPI003824EF60
MTEARSATIGRRLHEITCRVDGADRIGAMSDAAIGELSMRHATLQSCAQWRYGRGRIARAGAQLVAFGQAVIALAERAVEMPMPGFAHLPPGQIITPGFYFTAVVDQILRGVRRLLHTHDLSTTAAPGTLPAAASRSWALDAAADISSIGVTLSRFGTDLMTWGSSEYGFIDLPDEEPGSSTATPRQRNLPVLERIRSEAGRLSAIHLDLVLGRRDAPAGDMVEVFEEAGAQLSNPFDALELALRLLSAVVMGLEFRAQRVYAVCQNELLGSFTLANLLTLHAGVPRRQALVIAGEFVSSALADGVPPVGVPASLLHTVAERHGFAVADAERLLAEAYDVQRSLHFSGSLGTTHPDAVRALIARQHADLHHLGLAWSERRSADPAPVSPVATGQGRSGSPPQGDAGTRPGLPGRRTGRPGSAGPSRPSAA